VRLDSAIFDAGVNVVLEAQARGCAVVRKNSGGAAEYVLEGKTGVTGPAGNAQALAGALEQLLQDAARTRLGARARVWMEGSHAAVHCGFGGTPAMASYCDRSPHPLCVPEQHRLKVIG